MNLKDFPHSDDPAAAVILTVQRETLAKFGLELLAQQRAGQARIQEEMGRGVEDLNRQTVAWRRRMVWAMSLSALVLVPWAVGIALLGAGTLLLGIKTREAWGEYRAAQAAAQDVRHRGAVTVFRNGQLYVRIEPDSLAQGSRGNWYARAATLRLTGDAASPEGLAAR